MTIQKVTRAKPETEEVPSGQIGYIVVRRSSPDIHGETQFYVTHSPFSEVPVYMDPATAILQAENDEYIVQIDLPEMPNETVIFGPCVRLSCENYSPEATGACSISCNAILEQCR